MGGRGPGVAAAPAGREEAQDDPPWPDDAVEVGRVADAWGIKGGFKVQPYAAQAQALFSSRRWFLSPPEQRPASTPRPLPRLLRITSAREQSGAVVASAREVPDRDAARALQGARIFVSRASFPTPQADEFYWVDLIGMAVVNRQAQTLGTVTDLLDTGAHSVLRVREGEPADGQDGAVRERLIPFVAAYVDDVSLPLRRIVVDWALDY